jgi:hypothetical protein
MTARSQITVYARVLNKDVSWASGKNYEQVSE